MDLIFNGDHRRLKRSGKHGEVEDTGNVTGLVVGDCRGDNSSNAYRAQMNQSRKGFMPEPLVSQTQCQENHPTNN